MISRRAFVITATAGLLSAPLAARAQQPGKIYRIGYLSGGSAVSSLDEALDEGLRSPSPRGADPEDSRDVLIEMLSAIRAPAV